MKKFKKFELYRDNGGIFTLLTFRGKKVDYLHTWQIDGLKDIEFCLTDLQRPNCNPAQDWDNNELDDGIDGAEVLEMIDTDRQQRTCNFELIADNDGIYPQNAHCEEVREWLTQVNSQIPAI